MVRGISKRIVVIKSPDADMFEEAIFVVREDKQNPPDAILKEACQVAERYLKNHSQRAHKVNIFSKINYQLVAGLFMGILLSVICFLAYFPV